MGAGAHFYHCVSKGQLQSAFFSFLKRQQDWLCGDATTTVFVLFEHQKKNAYLNEILKSRRERDKSFRVVVVGAAPQETTTTRR